MSKDIQKQTLKKLDVLAKKIDLLTKVVAVSSHTRTAFKDKTKREQIKILSELELSRGIIALMVGTTPEYVSVTLSQMRAEEKKTKTESKEAEKENDEQKTV